MKEENIFSVILLIARPGAGKSEIIHYLSNLDEGEREKNYHIGQLVTIDDFPYLWRWFEEDHLLSQMGNKRLYTDEEGYFKETCFWDLLIQMINLEFDKFMRDSAHTNQQTIIIEFSRGKEHGGYKHALPLLSPDILKKLSILYVDVPWEESLRKNRQRFNPEKPDSVLEHSLPDSKLERLYRECDFKEMVNGFQGTVQVNGLKIPYAIFDNHDDVTTARDAALGARLKDVLETLWQIHAK